MPNIYNSDKYSSSFVNINNCATVRVSDHDVQNFRKNGRTDYLLMYVVSGKIYAKVNGREYTIGEKEAFLYHPNEPQEYAIYKKDNTVEHWVHFTGVEIDSIIKSLNFYDKHHLVMKLDTFDIEQMLSRLSREFNRKKRNYELICSGLLISVLSLMSRSMYETEPSKNTYDFVEHILGEFHSAPQNPFVIEDLAKKHNVTTNHLINSFKKSMGVTPGQYIIDFRMNKAKELLLHTDYTVFKISRLVGYANNEYFSRLFKKHVGISPLKFRKEGNKIK